MDCRSEKSLKDFSAIFDTPCPISSHFLNWSSNELLYERYPLIVCSRYLSKNSDSIFSPYCMIKWRSSSQAKAASGWLGFFSFVCFHQPWSFLWRTTWWSLKKVSVEVCTTNATRNNLWYWLWRWNFITCECIQWQFFSLLPTFQYRRTAHQGSTESVDSC